MGLKKYQHATLNELDSILLRVGMVKNQPSLFPEIYDNEGNIIPADKLTKANELSGAGVEYITSVCEYVYTHFLSKINRKANSLYDTLPPIEWDVFLHYATGGIPGQVERVQRTIMQYQAKPKTVLMIDKKGNLHARWPFILDFEWEGMGKLDEKTAARFARLNKTSYKKTDGDSGDNIPRLPIFKITIMAAKPLFEAFFEKSPSTYSFPIGMYAKMFFLANYTKRFSLKEKDKYKNKLAPNDYNTKLLEIENFDSDTNISAYTRFIRYIMRHNNLTDAQMKDKEHISPLSVKADDFVGSVYPSLFNINGRKERGIAQNRFFHFMLMAMTMTVNISDFLIYPIWQSKQRGNDILEFTLYTDQKKAQKALQRQYNVVINPAF